MLLRERRGPGAADRQGPLLEARRDGKELLHVASIQREMQELLTTY